jgi:signal transduction protein with GAF and PtsI domain
MMHLPSCTGAAALSIALGAPLVGGLTPVALACEEPAVVIVEADVRCGRPPGSRILNAFRRCLAKRREVSATVGVTLGGFRAGAGFRFHAGRDE